MPELTDSALTTENEKKSSLTKEAERTPSFFARQFLAGMQKDRVDSIVSTDSITIDTAAIAEC